MNQFGYFKCYTGNINLIIENICIPQTGQTVEQSVCYTEIILIIIYEENNNGHRKTII